MSDPVVTGSTITQIVAGAGGIGAFGIVLGRELLNYLRKRNEERDGNGRSHEEGGNGKRKYPEESLTCVMHGDLTASIKALGEKMDSVKDTVVEEGRKTGERLARLETQQEGTQDQVREIFQRINRREP